MRLVVLLFVIAAAMTACANDPEDPSYRFAPPVTPLRDDALPSGETHDPTSCEEAKRTKSYVGCDYWPTVTANGVWSVFDFAAVVANTGNETAQIEVTGPNGVHKSLEVDAGQTLRVYLPWVASLKGQDSDACSTLVPFERSVIEPNGAYHLVSTRPVIVYQFNPLQYRDGQGNGLDNKDWSSCPGMRGDCKKERPDGCFSHSNDASLLLPSTALTNTYRVIGQHGWSEGGTSAVERAIEGANLTITATEPGTEVTIALSPTANVRAGNGIAATRGGGTLQLSLANAGDVVELVTEKGRQHDFSGSLVRSTKPVQVITGNPCIYLPEGKPACDHIEEIVPPAETLGARYAVIPPTGPNRAPAKHNVRFVGNQDDTRLTYLPSRPPACPITLEAGEVVDCGLVDEPFEVKGTKEFGVATFLLAASITPPFGRAGDPSQSLYASVEQFRTRYVFLAPNDYTISFADIVATEDAEIRLDGDPLDPYFTEPFQKIGDGPLGIYRVALRMGTGNLGGHVLTSKKPIGVQVIGYGDYTTYQYPAGLDLRLIAAPPIK